MATPVVIVVVVAPSIRFNVTVELTAPILVHVIMHCDPAVHSVGADAWMAGSGGASTTANVGVVKITAPVATSLIRTQ